MKPLYGRILSLAGIAALVASGNSRAQDFFRDFGTSRSSGGIGPVTPSEYTYEDVSPSGMRPVTASEAAAADDQYNFAMGPIRFALAVGFGIEWNDNITLSEDDRKSDFIFRPLLNVDAAWRFSELNSLRFSFGASYAKYLEHSEYDTSGILLSPNSELELGFAIGVFQFTVRDRFSYQEDTYDVPQLSNVARYRRWENQIGIKMDWPVNEYFTFTTGYDHYNLWTRDDEFSSEQRAIDTFFITPTYLVAPGLKVGLNAAWSFIDFDTDERQDGDSFLIGPLIQWQISDVLEMFLEAGYQRLNFDGTSEFDDEFFTDLSDEERALFRDSDDTDTYYVKFELAHSPNDLFSHRLLASKTAEIGFGSNYYDLYHVEYAANWKGIRDTEIGPVLFYEWYETSGEPNEEAWRIGAAFGIRHHLTNSITLGLDYRFLLKDSNLEDASYYQNLVFLSAYYKF